MTKTITKPLFKKMVHNGAINLKNNYQEIDHLNVFPVPDGDTGTNMQMTMMAGVKEILNSEKENITFSDISKYLSRGLLMGARGNSGVILSQFFRGFHMALEKIKKDEITPSDLIDALVGGSKMAYKAVVEPVEGTILTVVRIAANKVKKERKKLDTVEKVFSLYLKTAKETLEKTPELLPQLKEAGVVDSGGAGFIKIIEGMEMAVKGVMLEDEVEKKTIVRNDFDFEDIHYLDPSEIKFSYCTEFIVKLDKPKNFKEDEIKDILLEMGDSLVIAVVEDLLKIHVHTNEPGIALTLGQKYGSLQTVKVENMKLQNESLKNAQNEVKNKKADTKKAHKKYGIIAVCQGKGIKDIFKDSGADIVIEGGQTMNPSTSDFVKAIEKINAEHIIIIPNNSNIIMAAEQTKEVFKEKDISVIPTKNIAEGFAAITTFDDYSDIENNILNMNAIRDEIKTAEITYSIRDTKINNIQVKKGHHIGLMGKKLTSSSNDRKKVFYDTLKKMYDDEKELLTIFYGKDATKTEIKDIKTKISKEYPNIEIETISGEQDIYSYILILE